MVEICAVGGYNEVGKNSTAVKIDDEVYILDLGLHLENYIKYTEDEDFIDVNPKELMNAGAVPDISIIDDWKDKVKLILPTHAHLDHLGAIPFLSNKFKANIMCTPFTSEVLKGILTEDKIKLNNKIRSMPSNSTFQASSNVKVEFIHVTHSTPHTVMIALHTREGIILYANDFKFDLTPTLGKKPNFKRLEELGKQNVLALICDSTYASDARKMPSESVAKQMLKEVMLGIDSKNKHVVVTTFASHIARLNSIVEFGQKMGRKIVFMGRSISKYVRAAEATGVANFTNKVEVLKWSNQIRKKLKKIAKDRGKYLMVVTGHQGEPKSTLSKMMNGEIKFKFFPEDHVIFSCKVIPTPTNIKNRQKLEESLKNYNVRIFKDIHQSGHAAREDIRDLIKLVKPKHIIPAHGEPSMTNALAGLAVEMGYKKGQNVHVMNDGDRVRL
ncbi:ribonuclease J [Candidatus Woesearchaeota archaeon]|jgi:ribonuclease J|nr:ribonuclease J [Candidatus Woesearchaeota archaeon]MDP6648278.1 RNase J family beta-CASP ribonuclease [Candidatus Woesearchaeota archaeon]|tara:strand:- start:32461 stop:33789 length:1329 start_codon:yes stop_codon:yes gene_type:complete